MTSSVARRVAFGAIAVLAIVALAAANADSGEADGRDSPATSRRESLGAGAGGTAIVIAYDAKRTDASVSAAISPTADHADPFARPTSVIAVGPGWPATGPLASGSTPRAPPFDLTAS